MTSSAHSSRTESFLRQTSVEGATGHVETLRAAAEGGFIMKFKMQQWHSMASTWSESHSPLTISGIDGQMQLALVLYHTMSICLTAMYNHPHYEHFQIKTPVQSDPEMLIHACQILVLVDTALSKTNIAGLLLCQPIMVASLRNGITLEQRRKSLDMLKEIERRGFVVTKPFERLMRDGWRRMDEGARFFGTSWVTSSK